MTKDFSFALSQKYFYVNSLDRNLTQFFWKCSSVRESCSNFSKKGAPCPLIRAILNKHFEIVKILFEKTKETVHGRNTLV